MKDIKPYLAWVGTKYYADFEAFAKEAEEIGVSKRIPTVAMGRAMMEEGSVVFLAHDDGQKSPCPDCATLKPCPRCSGKGTLEAETLSIPGVPVADYPCPDCEGTGKTVDASGGQVLLPSGKTMTFIEYWGHRKHPKKYPELAPVEGEPEPEFHRCEICGGTGSIPLGKIYGLFVPQGLEYVLRGTDTEKVKEEVESAGARAVTMVEVETERRRGCGFRKPGGTYLVTRTSGLPPPAIEKVVEELVSKGMIDPEAVEVKGAFVRFLSPVPIPGVKRFRGIKRWSMDPDVEEEASLILEAIE
jgi:hypothetical protein